MEFKRFLPCELRASALFGGYGMFLCGICPDMQECAADGSGHKRNGGWENKRKTGI